jgi:hypothetical protein
MKNITKLLVSVLFTLVGSAAFADGTEGLGDPSITIEPGTGVVTAGTGMISQPGTIDFVVPAGATINQVLLYWEGFHFQSTGGDSQVTVTSGLTSAPVPGTLIGGPAFFFSGNYASTYRADITGLGLVSAGANSLEISDMAYSINNNGAGVLVIFDDGSSDAGIQIKDGSDLAFINFPDPRQGTIAQTYNFAASTSDRIGILDFFFASVSGSASSGGPVRPTVIEITTAGQPGGPEVKTFDNVLDSLDGDEWDTFTTSTNIPAGATSITVQPFSRDDLGTGNLPASFDWLNGTLSIEAETPPGVPGRMTGGGSVFRVDGARVTRGFQIHCDLRDPNNLEVNWPGNRFHLLSLDSAVCTDSPAIDQTPPNSSPFDTFQGTGSGRLGREEGATIEFVFVDAGEPGTEDTASIKVWNPAGDLVLEVSGFMDRGNIQAHKDNQSTL